MKKSLRPPGCRSCHWRRGECLRTVLLCAGAVVFLACFFYRSAWAFAPLSAVGAALFGMMKRRKIKSEKSELAAEFRECILCVEASLRAGYSVENAFLETERDMETMFGKGSLICSELEFLRRGLHININLEELLKDIAERSGCEDIGEFAQVFALAKRSGGNMAEIIRTSAGRIGKKIELRQELSAILGGRRMELALMKLMPFGIVFYIELGTPGYFAPLYHNLFGAAVMTGCLGVYLGAYCIAETVMNKIETELL